ncbi:MAG: type II toxin-antitoxin system VapC family toxin [Candidatus Hodarchaeales archaeon]
MKPRFIDASTLVYAILEPTSDLPDNLKENKTNSRIILSRIDEGEKVITSVVHLSEVANILESRKSFVEVAKFMSDILSNNAIQVLEVGYRDYQAASVLAQRYQVGINESLAKILMDSLGLTEIYSFDKHFDNLNLVRITR